MIFRPDPSDYQKHILYRARSRARAKEPCTRRGCPCLSSGQCQAHVQARVDVLESRRITNLKGLDLHVVCLVQPRLCNLPQNTGGYIVPPPVAAIYFGQHSIKCVDSPGGHLTMCSAMRDRSSGFRGLCWVCSTAVWVLIVRILVLDVFRACIGLKRPPILRSCNVIVIVWLRSSYLGTASLGRGLLHWLIYICFRFKVVHSECVSHEE
jgi:hypothetical protein